MDKHITIPLLLLMATVLSIGSLNINGKAKDRLLYVNKIMQSHDFMFVQEHWLHSDQIANMYDQLPNTCIHGISGMEDNQLLHGRPHGGCAIIWKRDLQCTVKPVSLSSKRVCGVTVTNDNNTFLLITAYMPNDIGAKNVDLYTDTLHDISQLIACNDASFVVIGGDLNVDLNRQSPCTTALLNFVQSESLFLCNTLPNVQNSYSFESKANGGRSFVDHFLVSESIKDSIHNYYIQDDGDNLSDHLLLAINIEIPQQLHTVSNEHSSIYAASRPCWAGASENETELYKIALDNLLCHMNIPWDVIQCKDYSCHNINHIDSLESLHNDIVHFCLQASEKHIPKRSSSVKVKPGWHDYVEPFRQASLFWHFLWKENGKPREGYVALIHKQTRARYHRAVKHIQQNEDMLRATRMAEAHVNNNSRDFWCEVKKVKSKSKTIPSQIDGINNTKEISNHFARKYKTIYNSVSYNDHDLSQLMDSIHHHISSECQSGTCGSDHNISAQQVSTGIKRLKPGKHDGLYGHFSDHLKHSPDRMHVILSLLFTSMLTHGHTPDGMLIATICPIPKDVKKSVNDSNNYRSIALSSIIGKVFDFILIQKNLHVFTSSDLQFAYKPKSSTGHCTFVVNETINYYLENNTSVHAILLDATKAFDRVAYIKLFEELQNKGLCPLICKLLALQYTSTKCRVKWLNEHSQIFTVSNGVKQGGVLSPILFTLYMDCLLQRLKDSHCGCHIGHVYCGAFGYADDLILLSPSVSGMDKLLKICEEFSEEYQIKFNASKSKHILFNTKKENISSSFHMQGDIIPTVDSDKHLGNTIGANAQEQMINARIVDMYRNTNFLISTFSAANIDIRYSLFKTYCMSVYGAQLWDFSGKYCLRFFVAWRKCVRRLLGVPSNTHNKLIHLICNDIPVEAQLHKRFIKFIISCSNHKNNNVSMSTAQVLRGSKSAVGRSWMHMNKQYNCFMQRNIGNDDLEENLMTAGIIRDFLFMKNHLHDEQLNYIISDLCTN